MQGNNRTSKRKVTFCENSENLMKKKERAPRIYEPLRPRQLVALSSFDLTLETVFEEEPPSYEKKDNNAKE